MSHSRKDGAHGGGHRNQRGKEYWKSRLHRGGEALGRFTKRLTHRLERRRGKVDPLRMTISPADLKETPPSEVVDQYFRMLEENGMIHRLPLGADQGRPCLCQCQAAGFTHLELKALTLLVNSRRAYICSDDPYDETDYEPLAQSALAKIRALLPPDPTP